MSRPVRRTAYTPIFERPKIKGAINPGASAGIQAPIACFTWGPGSGDTEIDFDATCSSDPDGTIVGYQWNFGDTNTSTTGPMVSHTYAGGGSYNVTLRVTDNDGIQSVLFSDTVIVPHEIHSVNVPDAWGIAYLDGYCYMTASTGGAFYVIDVRDPTDPQIVDTLTDATLLATARWVATPINNGYMCYIAANDRAVLVHVGDPENPFIIGSIQDASWLPGAYGIVARDIAGGTGGALVSARTNRTRTQINTAVPASVSVSTTASSQSAVGFVLGASALNVQLAVGVPGGVYTVASANRMLRREFLNGFPAGSTFTDADLVCDENSGICVVHDRLYVTSFISGHLTIIDITSFGSEVVLGHLTDARLAGSVGVCAAGDYVFVTSTTNTSLVVVDVSTPASPVIVDEIIDATLLAGAARAMLDDRGWVHISSTVNESLTSINVSAYTTPPTPPPANLVGISRQTAALRASTFGGGNPIIDGDHLFVVAAGGTSTGGSMSVWDISDPADMRIVKDWYQQPLNACRISAKSGNILCTASDLVSGANTFYVVDVTDPLDPQLLGSVTSGFTFNGVRGIVIDGSHAYCAVFNNSPTSNAGIVVVVDLSTPSTPTIVGTYMGGNGISAGSGVKSGSVFFITTGATGTGAIRAIDVSTPSTPTLISGLTGLTQTNHLTNNGSTLYVTGNDLFRVVDASNPASMSVIGSIALPTGVAGGNAGPITRAGDLCYVATADEIVIVDVSTPGSPTIVGATGAGTGNFQSITVDGGLVYGTRGNRTMAVIDVS